MDVLQHAYSERATGIFGRVISISSILRRYYCNWYDGVCYDRIPCEQDDDKEYKDDGSNDASSDQASDSESDYSSEDSSLADESDDEEAAGTDSDEEEGLSWDELEERAKKGQAHHISACRQDTGVPPNLKTLFL